MSKISRSDDPITKTLNEIDARIAHLEDLRRRKQEEVDRDFAKHVTHMDLGLQSRLQEEIKALDAKLSSLRDERFKTEIGQDERNRQEAPRPAPRQWKIKSVPRPTFPAGSTNRKQIDKAVAGYTEHFIAEMKSVFMNAGISPDQTLSADLIAHLIGSLHGMVRWENDGRMALKDRVADLEAAPIRYRGVWQNSDEYKRGHVVTDNGSAWHAVKDIEPGERPGVSKSWQLMVKAGRDGKDTRP